jgi:hypothetical protein
MSFGGQNIIVYLYCCKKTERLINDFLDEFHADEGRLLNSEALIYKTTDESMLVLDDSDEWIPLDNQKVWIDTGLSLSTNAFSVYYSVNNNMVKGLIISFTLDNAVLFGVEIPDTNSNKKHAEDLCLELKNKYAASLGGIFNDSEIPPLSKPLFIDACKRALFVIN